LWIGGLLESIPNEDLSSRMNNGALGETFSCLLTMQFLDSKRGDRFFYENAPNKTLGTQDTAFTMTQLNEIKKQSLSALICRNYDLTSIQPKSFFLTNIDELSPNHPVGGK
jgi:peroxidase